MSRVFAIACLGWVLAFLTPAARAAGETGPEAAPVPVVETKGDHLPGIALSQGITEITGVAISPLLGVSSVGLWRYWNTPAEDRSSLPWYAQPWAWGAGMVVLGLCFLKDSLGTALPGVLKKPFDLVELFENKASALVASGAFVPLIAQEVSKHIEAKRLTVPTASLGQGTEFLAVIDPAWLLVPAGVIAFGLMFLCSHAINVLIILSPFSTVDALLKLLRTALLVLIGLLYALAPWLAAVVCVGLILVAAWLSPAAMRLAIFGFLFSLDLLLPRRGRKKATPEQPHVFSLGKLPGLPPRTGGRLHVLEDGRVVFRYRRWCMLDERTIPVPEGWAAVEKGLLSPTLVHGGGATGLFLFLPRYRGHEEAVSVHFGLQGVRDHAMIRGFSAMKSWLSGLLRRKALT